MNDVLRAIMERRSIRKYSDRPVKREDIETVVTAAERTGRKFRHRTNGRFLASARIGAVTVWCEYEPEGDAFRVHRAYSHRMRIGGEDDHDGQ